MLLPTRSPTQSLSPSLPPPPEWQVQEANDREAANAAKAQRADNVLNHILKNRMADASGCIDLFQSGGSEALLVQAQDILFRAMWWCKLRQAMLSIVSGEYQSEDCAVDTYAFANDLVRGHLHVLFEASHRTVMMDVLIWNVLLDNALSNAVRHGSQNSPNVTLRIEFEGEEEEEIDVSARVRPFLPLPL